MNDQQHLALLHLVPEIRADRDHLALEERGNVSRARLVERDVGRDRQRDGVARALRVEAEGAAEHPQRLGAMLGGDDHVQADLARADEVDVDPRVGQRLEEPICHPGVAAMSGFTGILSGNIGASMRSPGVTVRRLETAISSCA